MSTKRIPNTLLMEFSQFVESNMGLFFAENRWLDLLRGIKSAVYEFGFDDVEACMRWLMSAPLKKEQIEILAGHLTVGETYFFRETKIIEALEQHVFMELIRERRKNKEKRLRIWSAGCCTGEEPYTIAILLSRMIPDIKDWSIHILATDINPIFLKKATEGIYRDWSFRETPYWIKENYFSRTKEGCYEIKYDLKQMVKFSYLNLVEDSYPSLFNETNAMDVIFCRNVMMYFSPDTVKRIVHRLYNALLNNGWLIVGSSEASHLFFPQFVTVNFPGAILFRKDETISDQCRHVENIITSGFEEDPLESVDHQYFSGKIRLQDFEMSAETIVADESDDDVPEPVPDEAESAAVSDDNAEPIIKIISELYARGEYEEIIEMVIQKMENNGHDPEILSILSKSYANQGRLDDALKYCNAAIKSDKLNPRYHHLHAAILQEKGQIDNAIDVLKRTLYIDPNFVLAHFMLGNLKRQQGKFKESAKYFENALSILETHDREDILPESEGMNAGRLMELIRLTNRGELPA